jgi:hypothetical protein
LDEALRYPTGYEAAVMGVAERGTETFLVLDFEKAIEITQELLECDRDNALDYFYFNVSGSQMGEAYFTAKGLDEIDKYGI